MADNKDKNSENNTEKTTGKPEGKSQKPSKKNKDKESPIVRMQKWFHAKQVEFTSEFKKIVWPSRQELMKETVVVIVVSLLFGLYITVLDGVFGFLYSQFAQFASTMF